MLPDFHYFLTEDKNIGWSIQQLRKRKGWDFFLLLGYDKIKGAWSESPLERENWDQHPNFSIQWSFKRKRWIRVQQKHYPKWIYYQILVNQSSHSYKQNQQNIYPLQTNCLEDGLHNIAISSKKERNRPIESCLNIRHRRTCASWEDGA